MKSRRKKFGDEVFSDFRDEKCEGRKGGVAFRLRHGDTTITGICESIRERSTQHAGMA